MRKGFTLTLMTLAVALLATSVYAFGPTVGAVPDVWITEKTDTGAADGPQYMFRYSDAILLNDFVTPGVSTGNGSSSDTLYWAWALRQSNGTAGYGAWMTGVGVHYNAIGDDAADVQTHQPTFSVSGNTFTGAWESEVNGWAGKPTLAESGSLTFRNIRLNGTVDATNASPTSDTTNAQLPAGYLDAQEATVFVTDNATSPSFDMFQLITLLSGSKADRDTLSGGGPVYNIVEDYRTSTPNASWSTLGVGVRASTDPTTDLTHGPNSLVNNQTGTLTAVFPIANNNSGGSTSDPWFPAALFYKGSVAVTSDQIYRITARVQSSNSAKNANPSVGAQLNGRTSVGLGLSEYSWKPNNADVTNTPLLGAPLYLKGFLWPAANGTVQAWYQIWDTDSTVCGGTITLDQMLVESFDPTLLAGETVLADYGTGAASTFSGFSTGAFAFAGGTAPTMAFNAGTTSLSVTGQAGSTAANDGVGYMLHPTALFTTAAGSGKKLVVVKVMAKTTSSDSAHIPVYVMTVNSVPGNYRMSFYIDRNFSGSTVTNPTADLGATARPYYCIFESDPSKSYDISFFAVAYNSTSTNGNITIERVTALQYDAASETTSLP